MWPSGNRRTGAPRTRNRSVELLLPGPCSAIPFAAASAAIFQPVPGAPCVCFPVQHAGERAPPEDALPKAGWKPARLVDEALRVVRTIDDLFVRAEAERTTLRALGTASACLEGSFRGMLEPPAPGSKPWGDLRTGPAGGSAPGR